MRPPSCSIATVRSVGNGMKRGAGRDHMNVLFMQSQTFFGADSYLHSLLMKDLDRDQVSVHVALNVGDSGRPSAAAAQFQAIPDVHVRPTDFGVSLNDRGRRGRVTGLLRHGVPTVVDLAGLVRYARRNHIDLVHCTEKPRDAFIGVLVARLCGAKSLIELHVAPEDWLSGRTKWAMRHADALVGVSRFVADAIVAFGLPRERTYAVLNAIEVDRWDPTVSGAGVREEFGLDSDATVILTVSRLYKWKGQAELLRAVAQIVEPDDGVHVMVVGEDDPRSHPGGGSFTAELRALAADLGIEDRVIFTGFRSDVQDLMSACDIYAMPSHEEPFGMVFLEAMCMQRPVVALRAGGVPEVVAEPDAGLLSDPGDVDGLAANLLRLIRDPAERRIMGEAGRRIAASEFASERMARDMEHVYRRVLGFE